MNIKQEGHFEVLLMYGDTFHFNVLESMRAAAPVFEPLIGAPRGAAYCLHAAGARGQVKGGR